MVGRKGGWDEGKLGGRKERMTMGRKKGKEVGK